MHARQDILGRIVKGLSLSVSDKALAHADPRSALRTVLRAWLPLSEAVLGAAVEHLPSPVVRPCSASSWLKRPGLGCCHG